jgi:hypothetical protein
MPIRPLLLRAAVAALVAAVAVACAACGGGGSAASPVPHCTRSTAPAPAPAAAGPVAVAYLRALAGHRYDHAQTYAHACSATQQHSLDQLWLWLASMPTQAIKVTDAHVTPRAGDVTVSATLFARFGPAPYSAWVTLGPRTLSLTPGHGSWHVRADVSVVHRSDLAAYGVSWLHHPYFINGRRVTVIYAKPGDVVDAQQILDTADSVTPRLTSLFGGGVAGLRPVIFLVDNRSQGERLAHVSLGKVRTPAGFQYSSFAYVDLPLWRTLPSVEQASMVDHELTHVVTRPMLADAPHSLLEGIAEYEENQYVGDYGEAIPLDAIAPYYVHDAFPSLRLWERRESDWGLPNVRVINLAYEDALAMTHVIMIENGGVAGLRRLGAAFRAEHARRDFTAAEVQRAFRTGLHVSFARVAAEARAYVTRLVLAGG